jgi:hypothetical protein
MLASIIFVLFILAVTLSVMVLAGRFTAEYAVERGRSRRTWFLLGSLFFIFFPIPWMVLGLLPDRRHPNPPVRGAAPTARY